jgi:hypothetical protein
MQPRRLLLVITATAIVVPICTILLISFGPTPQLASSDFLEIGVKGLNEFRDKIVVFAWWVAALVAGLITVLKSKSKDTNSNQTEHLKVATFLNCLVLILLTLTYIADLNQSYTDNFSSIDRKDLPLSLVVICIIGVAIWKRLWLKPRFALYYLSCFIALLITTLLQTPATLQDFGHFQHTGNELAAPAAGLFPLSTFIPQYTVLLGWPIAPLLRLFPSEPVLIILIWIIALQYVCLVLPTIVAYRIGGIPAIAPTLTLLSALVVGHDQPAALGAASYFANFPLRIALPVILLFSLIMSIEKLTARNAGGSRYVVMGVIAGLTVLNNPDFGIPAAIAFALSLMLLAIQSKALRLRHSIVGSLSFGAVFLTYWMLGELTGNHISWSNWLFFQRIFGLSGFYNEPMPAAGIHVGFVVFFILCLVVGIFLVIHRQPTDNVQLVRIGLLLTFSSTWSILSLPYFAGRSYISTMAGGYLFQFGLCSIGLLLWILIDFGWIRNLVTRTWPLSAGLMFVVVFNAVFVVTMIARWPRIDNFGNSGRSEKITESVAKDISQSKDYLLNSGARIDEIIQVSELSNIVALKTGVKAALIVNHPSYLGLSPKIKDAQCELFRSLSFEFLLETPLWNLPEHSSFSDFQDCIEVNSLKKSTPSGQEYVQVLAR